MYIRAFIHPYCLWPVMTALHRDLHRDCFFSRYMAVILNPSCFVDQNVARRTWAVESGPSDADYLDRHSRNSCDMLGIAIANVTVTNT